MDTLRQDLRYALRMFAKAPGVTAAAVISLALGIGANTTVFTWTVGALLRPFRGVPEQGRLFEMSLRFPQQEQASLSYLDYRDLAAGARRSELVVQEDVALSLDDAGRAERVWGLVVSGNYFDVLHVPVTRGRTFDAEEAAVPAARAVAVISHALWQRRFGGDPAVVGRVVHVNTRPLTVVGVAPPSFRGARMGLSYDVFIPLGAAGEILGGGASRLADRGWRWLEAIGRLKPGTSLAQARAELEMLGRGLGAAYPDSSRGLGAQVYALSDSPWGGARILRPALLVLGAVVTIVLLVACANVANLLLARATARRREIAVRRSMGAGSARIVRQLLTESVLLGLAGGLGGLLAAAWAAGLLARFIPPTEFPIALDFGVDAGVAAFSAALSLAAGILFGLAPALQSTRADVAQALRDETAAVAGGGKAPLRHALAVTQIALSVLLLVSAGLLVRSVRNVRFVDTGFEARGMVLASLDLHAGGYTPESGLAFYRRLLHRAATLPGVESFTLARRAPLGFGGSSSTGLDVEGFRPTDERPVFAFYNEVGPRYHATLRIPLVDGRDFADADDAGAPLVAIVNETMAKWYWPGRSPIGGRVRFDDRWLTVVGVARDIKQRSLDQPPLPYLFLPVLQAYRPDVVLHARAAGAPTAVGAALSTVVRELDPALPVFGLRTLDDNLRASSVPQRLAGTLLVVFGALASLLAAIGLYGVLAYAVGQRTREIGLRVALGGRPADIVRLVVRQGLGLTAVGLVLGGAAALSAARGLGALLIGVSPRDPLTFAIVLSLLAATGLLACAVPARRATRIDPALALRSQ